MCKVMEDMRNEAVEKDRIQNAIEMLKDGLSIEKVAQYSRLAIDRVKELATPKAVRQNDNNSYWVATMCKVMEDMRNEADERRAIADIKSVMESFGVTIEKAMEALKIPVTQWDRYAGLVGKKMQ